MATVATEHWKTLLDKDGFVLLADVIAEDRVNTLLGDLGGAAQGDTLARHGSVYGERNVLDKPGVVEFCRSRELRALAEEALGPDCVAVRGLFFDKVPGANWNLSWHQDVTIAAEKKIDTPGFGPWSVKAGVPHVHAPATVLESMIAIRVHLDDCASDNGALEVIGGSHMFGKMAQSDVARAAAERPATVCAAPRGSALLMRPLLIHASKSAVRPAHRRVVHIEFAATELPGGLRWRWNLGR